MIKNEKFAFLFSILLGLVFSVIFYFLGFDIFSFLLGAIATIGFYLLFRPTQEKILQTQDNNKKQHYIASLSSSNTMLANVTIDLEKYSKQEQASYIKSIIKTISTSISCEDDIVVLAKLDSFVVDFAKLMENYSQIVQGKIVVSKQTNKSQIIEEIEQSIPSLKEGILKIVEDKQDLLDTQVTLDVLKKRLYINGLSKLGE